jgi:hypothetical protein
MFLRSRRRTRVASLPIFSPFEVREASPFHERSADEFS